MTAPLTYVLDAWPIAEWLLGKQSDAHTFTAFLNECEEVKTRLLISRINHGVLYTLVKRAPPDRQQDALRLFDRLALEVISVDDALVDAAIEIKKIFACSYADCFAAALAARLKVPVVTGDKEFLALHEAGVVQLEWLGA